MPACHKWPIATLLSDCSFASRSHSRHRHLGTHKHTHSPLPRPTAQWPASHRARYSKTMQVNNQLSYQSLNTLRASTDSLACVRACVRTMCVCVRAWHWRPRQHVQRTRTGPIPRSGLGCSKHSHVQDATVVFWTDVENSPDGFQSKFKTLVSC